MILVKQPVLSPKVEEMTPLLTFWHSTMMQLGSGRLMRRIWSAKEWVRQEEEREFYRVVDEM